MAKIFIGTPMYGGQCFGFYTQSILQLNNLLRDQGHSAMFSFMFNESLIQRGRNALAHGFLKTDCTHLFFIDADIRFNANDVPKMLSADKDILCGIYPKKEINWQNLKNAIDAGVKPEDLKWHTGSFVVNLAQYETSVTVPVNEPVEIWNGGTGFMLIKREVFEKMAEVVPSYTNDVNDLAGNLKVEQIKEFFATSIEEGTNRLLSEDYHFCKEWRDKCNGKVYAAPWAHLSHVGSFVFEGALTPTP